MTTFQGFEIVPTEGMVRHSRTTIRITVSAKKVCLSEALIRALEKPSHIAFYRGIDENEGKMIIACACEDDEKIQITPDRKKVCFWNSDFVSMCGEMMKKYAGGTFKRGTFFSIAGVPYEEYEVPAFVFDFKEAVEHLVKSPGNSKKFAGKKPHPAFNMPRGYTGMM